MAEKTLQTRILNKIDTLARWNESTLKIKQGEICLATVAASAGTGLEEPVVMAKIGTAEEKTFAELPWSFYAKASDVLVACKSEAGLTAFINDVIADADGDLAGLESRVEGIENALNAETTGLKDKVAANEAAIEAIEDRFGADTVALEINAAINALNLANTYAAKSLETTVSNHVADTVAHVTTADKTKWNGALQASDITAGGANGTIKVKGTDVAITGLGSAAFTESTAYDTAGAATTAESNAKKYAKDYADDLDQVMDGRVTAIENDYLKGADKTGLQEQITANDGEIAALHGLVGDKKVSEQISAITNPIDARVVTIEGDYLKAADKKELQDQIDANESAIELLTNGVSSDEVDGVNDLIQYVKDHGAEVTGMKEDIQDNADAIAAEKERAEGIEGGLETRLQAVEAMVSEDGAVKSDIADALTEAKKYTDDEVKELAEGAVATNAADIAALDTKVGDTPVATQITNVTNPMSEKITALEGKAHEHGNKALLDTYTQTEANLADAVAKKHEHANKAELDKIAEGDKAKWDAKVDDVTAAADSGLKATRTGNAIAIEIDESVTFIFDCGDSGVTA